MSFCYFFDVGVGVRVCVGVCAGVGVGVSAAVRAGVDVFLCVEVGVVVGAGSVPASYAGVVVGARVGLWVGLGLGSVWGVEVCAVVPLLVGPSPVSSLEYFSPCALHFGAVFGQPSVWAACSIFCGVSGELVFLFGVPPLPLMRRVGC